MRRKVYARPFVVMACAALALCPTACSRSKAEQDNEEIAAFCNDIAAEVIANPEAGLPTRRIEQKRLEKEWNPEALEQACSAALKRKLALRVAELHGSGGRASDTTPERR